MPSPVHRAVLASGQETLFGARREGTWPTSRPGAALWVHGEQERTEHRGELFLLPLG